MSAGKIIASAATTLLIATVASITGQFHKTALAIDVAHFYAPFALAYFSVLFMIPLYPLYLLASALFSSSALSQLHSEALQILKTKKGKLYPTWKLAAASIIALSLWICPPYLFGVGVKYVSVSVGLSILSLNSAMVFIISIFCLGTKFSWLTAVGIIFSVSGVFFLSMDSEFTGDILGVFIIFLAATGMAFYTTSFKKVFGEPSLGQIMLFQSLLGLANLLWNTAVVAAIIFFDLEHVDFKQIPWPPVLGLSFGMLTYSIVMNVGVAFVSPLAVAIGVLVGIPMTAAIDIIFRGLQASAYFYFGGLLISIGFCLTTFPFDRWMTRK
ncbi:unnamed protein product [Bursaphelenchus xylophilus]|uniref:(pine wood nematode) hypothetical protein n=1 Tax=Bursaphelenchus xylophilus TaxID=6326 RepID=A0A1I7S2T0_BURXY|nr:unnamed protein product [Bursaphelenchus xylophilus]CAG9121649.1 unnamed protein product [Bursaphelenchus xylophilus]